jgi:hypothetical protein
MVTFVLEEVQILKVLDLVQLVTSVLHRSMRFFVLQGITVQMWATEPQSNAILVLTILERDEATVQYARLVTYVLVMVYFFQSHVRQDSYVVL